LHIAAAMATGEDNKNSFEKELFPFMASPE